jgi:protein SCO1/2
MVASSPTKRAPHGALPSWHRWGAGFLLACRLGAGPAEPHYRVSVETCQIPEVVLLNQDGKKVRLKQLVESGDPVVLNFLYTSCTTICPNLAAGFANLQARVGGDPRKIRLVSITIDPGKDTPAVIKGYLSRFRAKPNWDFLTGSKAEVEGAMHGFNTFIPDTSSMVPLNFIYLRKERKWIRIFGVMSSSELLEECRKAGIQTASRN